MNMKIGRITAKNIIRVAIPLLTNMTHLKDIYFETLKLCYCKCLTNPFPALSHIHLVDVIRETALQKNWVFFFNANIVAPYDALGGHAKHGEIERALCFIPLLAFRKMEDLRLFMF